MLRITGIPCIMKNHNMVPNQEAHLGAIQQRKLQALVWWAKNFQHHCPEIITGAWASTELISSIMQINIESPLEGDIKVAHPGKDEIHQLWTIWVVRWENYISSVVGVFGIPLDYVKRCDIPIGLKAENDCDHLKYQAMQIGPDWEANKISVYVKLKAYFLDGEDSSWIKDFDTQKDGRQATAKLRENYEGDGEFNKHVSWATANIDNAHF